jgi:hypothetical protein
VCRSTFPTPLPATAAPDPTTCHPQQQEVGTALRRALLAEILTSQQQQGRRPGATRGSTPARTPTFGGLRRTLHVVCKEHAPPDRGSLKVEWGVAHLLRGFLQKHSPPVRRAAMTSTPPALLITSGVALGWLYASIASPCGLASLRSMISAAAAGGSVKVFWELFGRTARGVAGGRDAGTLLGAGAAVGVLACAVLAPRAAGTDARRRTLPRGREQLPARGGLHDLGTSPRIVLAVTGSVAAVKAPEIVEGLYQHFGEGTQVAPSQRCMRHSVRVRHVVWERGSAGSVDPPPAPTP